MSPFRNRGELTYRINVPTQAGGWKIRSTGTRDKVTATQMQRMVEDLGVRGRRQWDLLRAVTDGRRSLAELFDAYRMGTLEAFRRGLDDLDLFPYVARWQAWLAGRVHPETAARYATHLATLHQQAPWFRSRVTADAVDRWLSGLATSAATKRKYFAALASFLSFLDAIQVPHGEPLRGVLPPRPAPPRMVFLDLPDVQRLVAAAPGVFRPLFALLYGTGMDLSAALRLAARDIVKADREIRAAGTKSHTRDRVVGVAEWAWPTVQELLADKTPAAPLFPGITRYQASAEHRRLLVALELRGEGRSALRLHDARHHWAVRQIRAGTPIEIVARQLGHVDGTLALRVYGRFIPRTDERQRWEAEATRTDARHG